MFEGWEAYFREEECTEGIGPGLGDRKLYKAEQGHLTGLGARGAGLGRRALVLPLGNLEVKFWERAGPAGHMASAAAAEGKVWKWAGSSGGGRTMR